MGKVWSERKKNTNYSTRGRKKKAPPAASSPGLFDDSSVSSTSASAASNSASKDLSSDLSFQHRPAPGAESTFDRLLRGDHGGNKARDRRPVFGKARSAFDVWRGGPDSSSSYLESSPSVVANANAGNASTEPSSPGLFSSPAVLKEADMNRLR